MSLIEKVFGDLNEKEVNKVSKIANIVLSFDKEMQTLSEEQLKAKTNEFKERLANGETLDDLLPEAFAVCREAASRCLNMKHFEVQIIGGIVLHQGRISEMKTGEGKTLVATLPAYLNALEGKGVHVITVNDYLAKRDAEWMGKLYTYLGLSVGCIIHGISDEERKAAYRADITYGTNNEFGFDYLRDNMVNYKEQLTQRELNYAIIDEVDSILIDEARTPLIISGRGTESTGMYKTADKFVQGLSDETDYTIEKKDKRVSLTETGVEKCEAYFQIDNFSDPENMEVNHYVLQALKARYIMNKDIDYVVKDGEVVIVDEFTGRLMFGRRYNNGLHQAIEAKEGLHIKAESQTLATVTLQNYFRMYNKISGMTGTAKTEESEFTEIYNMDVVVIPTNRIVIRQDLEDCIYMKEGSKFKAIADKVAEIHATGQPVLVGTISIENSEKVSTMLKKRGIKHNVLNAKHHEKEAEIIAEAGRLNAVTIATNMAGRGTDIILGGNPEFEAKRKMKKEGFTPEQISFATNITKSDDTELINARERYNNLFEEYKTERKPEQDKVKSLGGLYIIGTERHESRRIDNQLRGRSGRQGDPGCTQFFISIEDDLVKLFGGERIQIAMNKLNPGDMPVKAKILTKSIENAQKKVEGNNFGIRRYVLQYDNVMNKQREVIYKERRRVLDGENLREYIVSMTRELIDEAVEPIVFASKYPEEWDFEDLNKRLKGINYNFKGVHYSKEQLVELDENNIKQDIYDIFEELYKAKEKEIGIDKMREIERVILLKLVDSKWMNHIDAMDQLKDGIGLRAVGQQDPVIAYTNEGFDMFEEMIGSIREDMVKYCYSVTVETKSERKTVAVGDKEEKKNYSEKDLRKNINNDGTQQNKPQKQTPYVREAPKVGRNDLCPCGSGKKYKNCCGK